MTRCALYILLFALFSVSCEKTHEERLEENISHYINHSITNSSGYQPMLTIIQDTITVGEFAEMSLLINENDILKYREEIDADNREINKLQSNDTVIIDEFLLKSYKESLNNCDKSIKARQDQNNKLEELRHSKAVAFYVAQHRCRLKNGFGVLDENRFYIIADDKDEILNVSDNYSESTLKMRAIFDARYLKK
ncbi:hypothetical protein V1389_06870 [Flavobacterium rakeshii]|uniref:hypothetical protein n=1 Tax=Flavobacterium rakeshii TaxID=1038845 RepID=UPI002E7BD610|nr:hypothetical protein [Flavobacterium rakeshii]MEE1898049.1 hypothetical protein [Flavobacterium rakeshii]